MLVDVRQLPRVLVALQGGECAASTRCALALEELPGTLFGHLTLVVRNAEQGLQVVADGRAIATTAATIANGLAHPGVVALPLVDGPPVATRLVWRTEAEHPALGHLIDLALAMTTVVERSA